MKKIKIIFMLLAVFLISGCEVKYNIELDYGDINEEIIIPYNKEYDEAYKREFYYDVINDKKYETSFKKINGIDKFVLTSKKNDVLMLANNDLTRFCFDSIDVLLEDNIYYIGTSNIFKCITYDYLDVNKLEINIKTFNKVIESNADKVSIGKYTWVIDENNFNDKNITFVVSKNEYVWYYKYKGLLIGLSIVGIVLFIACLIVVFFQRRSDKANDI